jgi:hypothetical protein
LKIDLKGFSQPLDPISQLNINISSKDERVSFKSRRENEFGQFIVEIFFTKVSIV